MGRFVQGRRGEVSSIQLDVSPLLGTHNIFDDGA